MTEAEWWGCSDPWLAKDLVNLASERRVQLLAAACVRRHLVHFEELLGFENLEEGILVLEHGADHGSNRRNFDSWVAGLQLNHDATEVNDPRNRLVVGILMLTGIGQGIGHGGERLDLSFGLINLADGLGALADPNLTIDGVHRLNLPDAASRIARAKESREQAHLLRDIFGNPFRPPPAIDPAWLRWRDGTIQRLAQQMYDSRDFASMPILADALEEAGCTEGGILEHCRGPGPHVRGCWVVDLILGKA